jgi:hypothetical protein
VLVYGLRLLLVWQSLLDWCRTSLHLSARLATVCLEPVSAQLIAQPAFVVLVLVLVLVVAFAVLWAQQEQLV